MKVVVGKLDRGGYWLQANLNKLPKISNAKNSQKISNINNLLIFFIRTSISVYHHQKFNFGDNTIKADAVHKFSF